MGLFIKSKEEKIKELKDIINRIISLSGQNPYTTSNGFQIKTSNKDYEIFIDSKLVFFNGFGEDIFPNFLEKRRIIKELKKLQKRSWKPKEKEAFA